MNDVLPVVVAVTGFAVVVLVLAFAYSIVRRPPTWATLKVSRWFNLVVAWSSDDGTSQVEQPNDGAESTSVK